MLGFKLCYIEQVPGERVAGRANWKEASWFSLVLASKKCILQLFLRSKVFKNVGDSVLGGGVPVLSRPWFSLSSAGGHVLIPRGSWFRSKNSRQVVWEYWSSKIKQIMRASFSADKWRENLEGTQSLKLRIHFGWLEKCWRLTKDTLC